MVPTNTRKTDVMSLRHAVLLEDEEQQIRNLNSYEVEHGLKNLDILINFQDLVVLSTSITSLKQIIRVYARKLICLLEEVDVLSSVSLSQEYLASVKKFWSLCTSQQKVLSPSQHFGKWHNELIEAVLPLVSVFIDLFIVANGPKENRQLWSKKLYSWLTFDLSDRVIRVALLEVTGHVKTEADIAGVLVSKILERDFDQTSKEDYLLHILLVKKWQALKDMGDIAKKCQSLKAPSMFIQWLNSRWTNASDFIPHNSRLQGAAVSQFLLDLDTDEVLESLTDVLQSAIFPEEDRKEDAGSDTATIANVNLFVVDKQGGEKSKPKEDSTVDAQIFPESDMAATANDNLFMVDKQGGGKSKPNEDSTVKAQGGTSRKRKASSTEINDSSDQSDDSDTKTGPRDQLLKRQKRGPSTDSSNDEAVEEDKENVRDEVDVNNDVESEDEEEEGVNVESEDEVEEEGVDVESEDKVEEESVEDEESEDEVEEEGVDDEESEEEVEDEEEDGDVEEKSEDSNEDITVESNQPKDTGDNQKDGERKADPKDSSSESESEKSENDEDEDQGSVRTRVKHTVEKTIDKHKAGLLDKSHNETVMCNDNVSEGSDNKGKENDIVNKIEVAKKETEKKGEKKPSEQEESSSDESEISDVVGDQSNAVVDTDSDVILTSVSTRRKPLNLTTKCLEKNQILLTDPVYSSYFKSRNTDDGGNDIEVIETSDVSADDEQEGSNFTNLCGLPARTLRGKNTISTRSLRNDIPQELGKREEENDVTILQAGWPSSRKFPLTEPASPKKSRKSLGEEKKADPKKAPLENESEQSEDDVAILKVFTPEKIAVESTATPSLEGNTRRKSLRARQDSSSSSVQETAPDTEGHPLPKTSQNSQSASLKTPSVGKDSPKKNPTSQLVSERVDQPMGKLSEGECKNETETSTLRKRKISEIESPQKTKADSETDSSKRMRKMSETGSPQRTRKISETGSPQKNRKISETEILKRTRNASCVSDSPKKLTRKILEKVSSLDIEYRRKSRGGKDAREDGVAKTAATTASPKRSLEEDIAYKLSIFKIASSASDATSEDTNEVTLTPRKSTRRRTVSNMSTASDSALMDHCETSNTACKALVSIEEQDTSKISTLAKTSATPKAATPAKVSDAKKAATPAKVSDAKKAATPAKVSDAKKAATPAKVSDAKKAATPGKMETPLKTKSPTKDDSSATRNRRKSLRSSSRTTKGEENNTQS